MGSYKDETDVSHNKFRKIVRTCVACLASFLMSMFGGLIMVWWELKYHPTNSQLWMVPFALIIMVTPVIVWFSAFVSDFYSAKESGAPASTLNNQPASKRSDDDSFHDPEI